MTLRATYNEHALQLHSAVVGKTSNLTELPWDKDKGSLIEEGFSLWSFPRKNVPNHYPQLCPIKSKS